ncbi:MAG: hypothetical protein AMXMBFR7_17440 [Planctomycetota bacterium]
MAGTESDSVTHDYLESLLGTPHADGVFVLSLGEDARGGTDSLRPGDIVTHIGGQALTDMGVYYKAMKPGGADDKTRRLTLARQDGRRLEVTVPSGARSLNVCPVKTGVPAWTQVSDFEEEPDFSALHDGVEHALRNSFGEEAAGWERIRIARRGELIDVEIDFRLGGHSEPGKTWEYYTLSRSTHRLDRSLSLARTAFWDGKPGQRKLRGDVELGANGLWRGVHVSPSCEEQRVEFKSPSRGMLTGYTTTLLPLIMPLREGAAKTFAHTADGNGRSGIRERIECTGRQTVRVDGQDLNAWCFAWRHYGTRPPEEDEKFYVTDDRKLVRIDWGPSYGFCWCEAVPKDRLAEGVPAHVLGED